jgi:hypothetical protein
MGRSVISVIFEVHLALGGPDKPDDHVKRSGFAGAVRPQQTDDFALLYLKGNVAHHGAFAVDFSTGFLRAESCSE